MYPAATKKGDCSDFVPREQCAGYLCWWPSCLLTEWEDHTGRLIRTELILPSPTLWEAESSKFSTCSFVSF